MSRGKKLGGILFIIIVSAIPIMFTLFKTIDYFVLKDFHNQAYGKVALICLLLLFLFLGFVIPKKRDEFFRENFFRAGAIGFIVAQLTLALAIISYILGLAVNVFTMLIFLFCFVFLSYFIALIYFRRKPTNGK